MKKLALLLTLCMISSVALADPFPDFDSKTGSSPHKIWA